MFYITEVFCAVDDFCKNFEKKFENRRLRRINQQSKSGRPSSLTASEVMTIVIMFHHSKMRTFKDYYKIMVQPLLKGAFPGLVSYNRFVELMQLYAMHLYIFLEYCRLGKVTGIAYVDSTSIKVCHNLRIGSNKVFKHCARRGKTSTGWFYGFKLHLVVNEFGEILAFDITSGNVDDRNKKVMNRLTKSLWGKLFGDRGYLSVKLFKQLFAKGIHLVTKLKKRMKGALMPIKDKYLLSKRGMIESVIGILKASCQIEHSRHRSPVNFFVNIIAGLIAYSFLEKKPSIIVELAQQIKCS